MSDKKAKDGSKRGGKRPGAGRPPGAVDPVKAAHKKTLEELAREHTDVAIQTLIDVCTGLLMPPAARVTAANSLLDRGYGKPVQALKHSGDEENPLNLGVVFVGANPNDLIPHEDEPEGEE